MANTWPFCDVENTAVFTSKRILRGEDWIYYVTHDAEDGAWQFHPHGGMTPEAEAGVVSLKTMTEIDCTVRQLADLPRGWHAWRESKESSWMRSPKVNG